MKKTAILVDGGFFLKRYRYINKIRSLDPIRTANDLWGMCLRHLTQAKGEAFDLYRIYYYDCLPYDKKQHNPVTGKSIDFSRTEQHRFQLDFFEELKKKRKIALRLGVLEDKKRWMITPSKTKAFFKKKMMIDDLREGDVQFDFNQKRVDIKIGLDIAAMTLKNR